MTLVKIPSLLGHCPSSLLLRILTILISKLLVVVAKSHGYQFEVKVIKKVMVIQVME